MTHLAQIGLAALLSIPLIAFSILARAARHRVEQSRDQHADWLRAPVSTSRHGSVTK